MGIHIGEIIKERAREVRMGPTELAKKVNTTKQNVYGIFKRKTVDTELLQKLSQALDYNFFQYYIDHEKLLMEDPQHYGKTNAALKEELRIVKKDYIHLKEKYELLKQVNELLKSKVGK